MNELDEKTLQKLFRTYVAKFPNDAELIRRTIKEGDAVSLYLSLSANLVIPIENDSLRLFHNTRLFYFLSYCLKYNNGIPLFEILNHIIDTSPDAKILNALKSHKTLINFLISQNVDLKRLKDYMFEKETTEIALGKKLKSTEVLQRILSKIEDAPKDKTGDKTQNELYKGYNAKQWCTILYFSDYSNKQPNDYDTELIKAFHKKHKLPFMIISFQQNFKIIKSQIEQSHKSVPKNIEKILPFFSKDKDTTQYIKNQLNVIKDDISRNE